MFSSKIYHRNVRASRFYWNHRKFFPKILRPWLERSVFFSIWKNAYTFYMSLGENCLPAKTLNEVHLRKFSGPFDWIAKNGFEVRINQIKSHFKDTLNYEDLHFDLKTRTDHNACLVHNLKTDFLYPHDFNDDSKEEFIKQAKKYQRRQDRIYSLAKGANGLFLYSDITSGLRYSEYANKIQDFLEGLQSLQNELKMDEVAMILVVKGEQGMNVDFLDHYKKNNINLFVQPIPYFENEDEASLFDWHGFFIKRALGIATRINS